MSAQGLKPYQRGDKLTAKAVNAIIAGVVGNTRNINEVISQQKVGKFLALGADTVQVHNTEATTKTAYTLAGIDSPTYKDDANELTEGTLDVSDIVQASHFDRYVVLAEDIAPGANGLAWRSGFVLTLVNIADLAHKCAQVAADDDVFLTSSYTGNAQIIWYDDTDVEVDDLVWCIVRFQVDFFQTFDPMPAIVSGTAATTIAPNALLVYDGWDATAKLIKVKKVDEDSPDMTCRHLGSAAVTVGDTTLITPSFGKILFGTYDTAPTALLDEYGAASGSADYKKGNTGYRIIADLGSGGYFAPFRSAGGGCEVINFTAIDSAQKKSIDSADNTSTQLFGKAVLTDGGNDLDTYINLDSDIVLPSSGYYVFNVSVDANTSDFFFESAFDFEIYYSATAWNLAGITTWAGRPTGTLLKTYSFDIDLITNKGMSFGVGFTSPASDITIRGLRFALTAGGTAENAYSVDAASSGLMFG